LAMQTTSLCVLFALMVAPVAAQMGSGRRQRDREAKAVKADLKPIACDTCEIVMDKIFEKTEAGRAAAPMVSVSVSPGKRATRSSFSEADVNDVLAEVCHRRKPGGEWAWYTDLVEAPGPQLAHGASLYRPLTAAEKKSGERFLLVSTTAEPGKWDHERASILRACSNLMEEDVDQDELAVRLWRGDFVDASALKKAVCKEMSRACKGSTRKPLPKGRHREDAPHEAQDRQMLDTEQMMQNMEEAGSPMVMQSREDIEEEMREMAEEMGMTPEEMEAMMASGGGGGGEEMGGMAQEF